MNFLTTLDFGQPISLNYKSMIHWSLHDLMLNELKSYHFITLNTDYLVITVFHGVEGALADVRAKLAGSGFTARRAGVLSKNIVIEKEL